MHNYIKHSQEKLDIAADKGDMVNVSPLITLCTLEVVLKCVMGYDLDIQRQGYVLIVYSKVDLFGYEWVFLLRKRK